jgi:hypothetical protein
MDSCHVTALPVVPPLPLTIHTSLSKINFDIVCICVGSCTDIKFTIRHALLFELELALHYINIKLI